MLLYLALVILALIVALLLFAATRPDAFITERSTRISAPAERIVSMIDDFHQWAKWSPWEKLDPTMTRTFSGAPHGVGAVYEWSGNGKAGAGRMEISQRDAGRVAIPLTFIRPFKANNLAEFLFAPDGDATRVTWRMSGNRPFVAKLFGIFMDMDALVGRDFEAGLATLRNVCEQPAASTSDVSVSR